MIFENSHLVRVFQQITYFVLSIIGIYLAFKLAVFYMPFLIAFIISLIMEPAIKFIMNKAELTRRASSIIIFIIVFGLIAGGLAWGIVTLISEATDLLQVLNDYFDKAYIEIQNFISKFNFDKIKLSEQITSIINSSTGDVLQTISEWTKKLLTSVVNIVTSLPTIAIYFVITILSLYFICTDKIYILDQAEHHLPKSWSKKLLVHLREITKTLGCYLKAQVILIVVSFFISVIGLYIYKFMRIKCRVSSFNSSCNSFCRCSSYTWLWLCYGTMGNM